MARRFFYQVKTEPVAPVHDSSQFQVATGNVSGPRFARALIYSTLAYCPFTPTAVVVDMDSWFRPLSEPVLVKKMPTAQQQSLAWNPFTPTKIDWFVPLSEPSVKARRPVAQQQDLAWSAFTPETVTLDKWYQALSERSVKTKAGLAAANQQPLAFTERQTDSRWREPWSEPVRLKPGLHASLQHAFEFQPNPIVDISWFNPLSEPSVKVKKPVAQQQDIAWGLFTPEVVTVDKWFGWLSEPSVKIKLGLLPSAQQFLAYSNFVETTSDNEAKWHQGWPDFARVKTQPHPAYQQFLAFWNIGENISLDKWYKPLETPVRIKLGLLASEQQFFAFNPFPITKIDWFAPLSEPSVKVKKPVAQQQSLAWGTTTPEFITLDKWYQALSEPPVKYKRAVAQQQFLTAWSGFTPAADIFVVSFSDSLPPSFFSFQYQSSAFVSLAERITEDKWHQGWSTPRTLARAGLPTSAQQAYAYPPFVERVTEQSKWYQSWSEPVRIKPGLRASQQHFFEYQPRPIISIGWYAPFREPVRIKRGLGTNLQQTYAYPPFVERITEDKWHQAWSEPIVKSKRRLAEASQQFLAYTRTPVVITITLTLNATETGDSASMSLLVASELVQAIVSVFEIEPQYAISSRVEEIDVNQVQAIVSVFEIEPKYAISSRVEEPSASQVQAIVSIIEI